MTTTTMVKKAGRPRTGKVLFAARVKPEMVPLLKGVIEGNAAPVAGGELEKAKGQLADMTACYEQALLDKEAAERQLDDLLNNPETEEGRIWKMRYGVVAAALKAREDMG